MMALRSSKGLASAIIFTTAASLPLSSVVNANSLNKIIDISALLSPLNGQVIKNSRSFISPISKPLGDSLAPLVNATDTTLDPLTDPIDELLGTTLLGALAPITDPLLDILQPATDPIDGIVADLTGGSVSDAMSNIDKYTTDGDGIVNDLLGGPQVHGSGTEAGERSPLGSISANLGAMLEPLITAIDVGLDPLTDLIDDHYLEPILDALAPVTDPLLAALEPVTDPVDGLVADLTGGSLEDALTNIDDNTADGNGVVNDLLGGESENTASGTEAGEASILAPISGPLGNSLANLVTAGDTALDPITDPVDDQLGEALLDALAPVTDPLLTTLDPVTDPVDGLLYDLTGGSIEDALSNTDDNSADGDGIVNDLLGGSSTPASEDGSETSPLGPISASLGESLVTIVDAVDTGLDPLTDVVDDEILQPVLEQLAPLTEPLLAQLEPITSPADGLIADLTGGSLEDALTNSDDNTADGNGLVNDLLGGDDESTASGTQAGESSALQPITEPLGDSINNLVTALNPITDVVDDQIGEPLLDALAPVLIPALDGAAPLIEPVLGLIEPITDPIDGAVADLPGSNLEDALTNDDDNTADGNGLVNDLLGGGNNNGAGNGGQGNGPLDQAALIALLDRDLMSNNPNDPGGCRDRDADGVCDEQDECPGTPLGKAVLASGCHLIDSAQLRLNGVLFEFNSATLTTNAKAILDAAVLVIQQSDAEKVEVAGHTDGKGIDSYNLKLSQTRAQSVKRYLANQGVDSLRLSTQGYGRNIPIASNDTAAGRAKNRRVELAIINTEQ